MDYGACGRDQLDARLMRYEPPETPKFFINSFYNQYTNLGSLPFVFDEEEDDDYEEDSDYEALADHGERDDAWRRQVGEKNTSNQDVNKVKTDQEACGSPGFFTRVFGWTKDAMLACLCST